MHGEACTAMNVIGDHTLRVMGFGLSYLLFTASKEAEGSEKRTLLYQRSSPALVKFLLRISLSDVLKKLAAFHNQVTLSERRTRIFASRYGPNCIESSYQYESHHCLAWMRREHHVHFRQVRHAEKRTISQPHTKCNWASALPLSREAEGINQVTVPEGVMVTK
jgi:hypothetical protein